MLAYIALGANIGKPLEQLTNCLEKLEGRLGPCRRSRIYRTRPVGLRNQPDFYNMVIEVDTALSPLALLQLLHAVEAEMGRVRLSRNEPRPIDCDLLLCGTQVVESGALCLPHPEMHRRDFVLAPLCDLNPQLQHPRLLKSMAALWEEAGSGNLLEIL